MKTQTITPILAALLILLPFGTARAADALLTDDASVDFGGAFAQPVGTGSLLRVNPLRQRAYLKFDLTSTLPFNVRGYHVEKATLRLFVSRVVSPGTIGLSIIGDPWNEVSLTIPGANQLRDSFNGSARYAPIPRAGTFMVFDVTEYVGSWLNGGANHGFVLRGVDGAAAFDSKENTATGHEPVLQIIFRSLPDPSITYEPNGEQ